MNIRAVIFDIYGTILEVGPPPPNADMLWQDLFREVFGVPPKMSRTEFAVQTARIVARHHAVAKSKGIPWPEVHWPSIVAEAIPDLSRLSRSKVNDFIFRQMQIGRTLNLAEGAAGCLAQLHGKGVLMGIASNSQAYTLQEVEMALQAGGLNLSIFDRDLLFWSFENGFSKPDPHVFRMLSTRLEVRGIRGGETMMVGDRIDNDMEPAAAQGWQTWHLVREDESSGPGRGGFRRLASALK